eukprot:TRINITY_DN2710_c0_g1_i2.p1 TRINITY_DN2710_c0_g1~~TRINITY_DN2710_c0_g1_i2.p1  ORF type:complete len:183 (-),score=9.41 TRINITY_DN2710_c0_g1_i2:110-637(-)
MTENTKVSLISADVKSRVSSVLNRNAKQFGKQHMFDNSSEMCWNSDQVRRPIFYFRPTLCFLDSNTYHIVIQGKTQFVVLDFPSPVHVETIQIMFQGGFAGKGCEVHGIDANATEKTPVKLANFYPVDVNSLQSFDLPADGSSRAVQQIQIIFPESTDFYGRIVIYKLDVLGRLA